MSLRPIGGRPIPLARLFLGVLAGLALLATPAVSSAQGTNPVITHFQAVVGPGGYVTFSGTVTDDHSLAGCLVMIERPGVNTYAVILADGTFNTSVQVIGVTERMVTAQAIDADGNLSDEAYATFTPSSGGSSSGTGKPKSGGVAPLPPPPPGE